MSKIRDLEKKVRAMNIRGSNSLLLDIVYINELLEEIKQIEDRTFEESKSSENEKNQSVILHGGKFQ